MSVKTNISLAPIASANRSNKPPIPDASSATLIPTPFIKFRPDKEMALVTLIFMWGKMWGKII